MNILTLNISQLIPGMILAEDVYTSYKEKLLSRNTMVSPKVIMKLKLNAIPKIMVYIPSNLAQSHPITESANANELKNSLEFKKFKKYYMETTNLLRACFFSILGYSTDEFSLKQLIVSVRTLLSECRSSLRIYDMLQCMREYDDLIYIHSMNVTLICASFQSFLNLSEEDYSQLLLAAMFHDIGKLKIPQEIINKPTALTDEEFRTIQRHPELGCSLIKPFSFDQRIQDAILMHHERCDGSGYPRHLLNNEIAPFAKIIAIADVYDAMTANRIYRNGICPFHVIHCMEQEGYQKYDPKYLLPFLEQLALAYMNATVQLSNSLIGEVVMINKLSLSKPIVKVENQFFDLSKIPELKILNVL